VLTARALARSPQVLLLDEPGAFLGVAARAGLLALLRDLARTEKMCVVVSTHDLELALLRTGSPEEPAAAGRIGAVFDTPAPAFDAESGTFDGTGAAGSTVRVRGEHAALLGQALRREGWTAVPDGPADAEVTGRAHGFRAQSAGATVQLAGWSELGEWARTAAVAPPRRAGDAEVAAVLDAVAAVGPYFAVHARDGAGWLALDACGLAALTDTVGERLGTSERRVAASIMFQGLAARLVSPVLAGLGRGIVLDLDPAATAVRSRPGEAMDLTCPQIGGWLAPEPDVALVADVLLEQQLRPLVEAVAADGPVAAGLLWGNVSSALVGALGVLGGGADPVAARVVGELLEHGPLAGTGDGGPAGFRRRSCCLFYRTPAGGYCGDCALVPRT
jgi:iron complex transport system ATP-binding protein